MNPSPKVQETVDLQPRREPIQARAKRTVELILDTTALLLEELGLDQINTNLIAERAGLPVRSIYRYFPNKIAIVYGLAQRFDREWEQLGDEEYHSALADPSKSIWSAHKRWVELYLEHLRSQPGSAGFRRAIEASPPLRDLNRHWTRKLARAFSRALEKRGVDQSLAELELIGLTLYQSGGALVDLALTVSSTQRERHFAEVLRQQKSYLEAALGRDVVDGVCDDAETARV